MAKISKRILTTCVYCGTGCNLYLHVENDRIIGATPCESHPVSQGKLCIKGWKIHEWCLNTGFSKKWLEQLIQRTTASLKNAISLVKRIENNLERRL